MLDYKISILILLHFPMRGKKNLVLRDKPILAQELESPLCKQGMMSQAIFLKLKNKSVPDLFSYIQIRLLSWPHCLKLSQKSQRSFSPQQSLKVTSEDSAKVAKILKSIKVALKCGELCYCCA